MLAKMNGSFLSVGIKRAKTMRRKNRNEIIVTINVRIKKIEKVWGFFCIENWIVCSLTDMLDVFSIDLSFVEEKKWLSISCKLQRFPLCFF